jgi:hypothetical protein
MSARSRNSAGGISAAATANSAFGRPPFRIGRAARRDAPAIAAAWVSRPMTRTPGSAAAVARTARPSPVPRSTITRSWRATRLSS